MSEREEEREGPCKMRLMQTQKLSHTVKCRNIHSESCHKDNIVDEKAKHKKRKRKDAHN